MREPRFRKGGRFLGGGATLAVRERGLPGRVRFLCSHDDSGLSHLLCLHFFYSKSAFFRSSGALCPACARKKEASRSFLFFLRSLPIMGALSTCSSGRHSLSIRKGCERRQCLHIPVSCAPEKRGRACPACTKMLWTGVPPLPRFFREIEELWKSWICWRSV